MIPKGTWMVYIYIYMYVCVYIICMIYYTRPHGALLVTVVPYLKDYRARRFHRFCPDILGVARPS